MIGLTGSVVAAGLAWLAYFCVKDRYDPEPLHLLGLVFLGGAASTVPAFLLYRLVERAGVSPELALAPDAGRLPSLLYCVLVVGAVEEGCKFLSVQILIGRHHAFDEHVDGVIYAAVGALGFASVESMVLGRYLDGPELWGRVVAAPLTHALFASIWGFTLSLDRFARPRRPFRVMGGLAVAAVMHGLYDHLVLSPGSGRYWAAGLVLILWIAFFFVVSRLLLLSPYRSGRVSTDG